MLDYRRVLPIVYLFPGLLAKLVQLFSQRKNQTLDLDPSKFYRTNNSRDESSNTEPHSFQEGQRCKVLNFSMKVTRWWSHFF